MELDKKLVTNGVVDGLVDTAIRFVDVELKGLRPRRTALLAGHADPADQAKLATPVATPPQLRPPRRITTKEARATASEIHKRNVEAAKLLPLDMPLQDIQNLYCTEASVALTEMNLHEYQDDLVPNGRPANFMRISTWPSSRSYGSGGRKLMQSSYGPVISGVFSNRELRPSSQGSGGFQSRRCSGFRQFNTVTAPLLKRIEELERRPKMEYMGTWDANKQYEIGDVVTDHGSMFFCRQSTRERPGENNSCWKLCVKRGQDGRDGRAK